MARWTTLGGYPVKQYNSPNRGGAMSGHRGVVEHIAEGTYLGTISWQMNPDQRYSDGTSVNTCSTWIVGKNTGEIAQMVDTDEIAWCQRSGSRDWLSIEFAGYHTQPLTAWQIEAAALILAKVHEVYGVPIQVATDPSMRGLGHHSMDRESLGEEWGHEDCPGQQIIAQKPQVVARALDIAGDDMQLTDKLSDTTGAYQGYSINYALVTLLHRTGAVEKALPKLDAILAAALDDDDVTVQLSPEALAELTAIRDALTAVPAAVADEQAARLAG